MEAQMPNPDLSAALQSGHTSIIEEAGFRHDMMARCPTHGTASPIEQVTKQGRQIVDIVFCCPTDGALFRVPLDQVFFA